MLIWCVKITSRSFSLTVVEAKLFSCDYWPLVFLCLQIAWILKIIRKTTNIRKCHVVEEYRYKEMIRIPSKVIKVQTVEHFYSIIFLLKNMKMQRQMKITHSKKLGKQVFFFFLKRLLLVFKFSCNWNDYFYNWKKIPVSVNKARKNLLGNLYYPAAPSVQMVIKW